MEGQKLKDISRLQRKRDGVGVTVAQRAQKTSVLSPACPEILTSLSPSTKTRQGGALLPLLCKGSHPDRTDAALPVAAGAQALLVSDFCPGGRATSAPGCPPAPPHSFPLPSAAPPVCSRWVADSYSRGYHESAAHRLPSNPMTTFLVPSPCQESAGENRTFHRPTPPLKYTVAHSSDQIKFDSE